MATIAQFTGWLRAYAEVVREQAPMLTELDAVIGDADHGSNLDRGMQAVCKVLDDQEFTALDALFKTVGMTLVSSVGGASGPLYGSFFLRFGTALQGGEADAEAVGKALTAGVEAIRQRGKAEAGDKTMLDALLPALEAYQDSDGDLEQKLAAAAAAARSGADRTEALVARKGRASYLGERSAGHRDPGATSATMLLDSAAATLST